MAIFINMKQTLKIGLFGIGLDAYWEQFPGLESRLKGYLDIVATRLKTFQGDVLNVGLVDNMDKAFDAGTAFRTNDADILFLYVTTYALSSTVISVVRRAGVPVVVLNVSPSSAIDYNEFNQLPNRTAMTGEWLAYCNACPVPEIANVFQRSGIPFHQVTGTLDANDSCWGEVKEWIEAAHVAKVMQNNRMGCMGHYYSGMVDIYTDMTRQLAHFGGHMEMLEVDELTSMRKTIPQASIEERIKLFHEKFEVQKDCAQVELESAARTSCALDQLVARYQLGSLAYYYKGTGTENEETISSIILGNSLLTANHIPVAGEYEIKNVQAMKILDAFGVGGSFTEYYAMDFQDDVVLMGHDGPGHIGISEGKTKVKPLEVYHGKVGKGLSVEMSVKNGPVTLLSVVETRDGGLMLLTAHGESVSGPILQIGNTNSRYRFGIGAKKFVESWNSHGPAHHCAVGVGHMASRIQKLGQLLKLQVIQVC